MARIPQPGLFGWREIEGDSDLNRLRLVLSVLPDETLVRFLEQRRGHGVNRYPIRPCWNALLAGVVFQHLSMASLLRELRRNGELRDLCGFDPFLGGAAVPSEDAFGRFLAVVVEHAEHLRRMFDVLLAQLGAVLPDLGQVTAVDSKAIPSFGHRVTDPDKQKEPDGRRDLDADTGTKTYKGVHKDGTPWEKVVKWFGYKLHLLVDSRYEMPLAFEVTKASPSDTKHLIPLVEQVETRVPEVGQRIEQTAADKGYDSAENNRALYDDHQIVPVIDSRSGLWRGDPTKPLDPDRVDVSVYNERGEVFCVCPLTGTVKALAFCGFEADRKTLKYRCPAAAFGFDCPGRKECESYAHVGPFGRTFRVPLDTDRRIFVPFARHTRTWKKAYARRTAVERVNSRIDRLLGFEQHTIRGLAKMTMRVTLGLVVMLAMALGRIRLNQKDKMRSFVAPAPARKAA